MHTHPQISITESKKVLLQTLDPAGNIQEAMEISGNGLDVSVLTVRVPVGENSLTNQFRRPAEPVVYIYM